MSLLETLMRIFAPDLSLASLVEAMERPPPGCREEVEAAMADLDAAVADGEDARGYFDEVTLPWLHEASVMNCDGSWPTDFKGEPVEPAEYKCSFNYDSNTQCYDASCTCVDALDCGKLGWFCNIPNTKVEGNTCSRRSC